ncbi:hypothetical protein PAXRUDRAFT_467997 [Paxillus rubicundulus Ve08.2h10]|uniref:Uncharacterized protein n=1 Tax=Paxillus rubicundulus Ve08.2h10 TaxID=930991 RepID=A0A0D0DWF2_9AGAM|nr:hypothetical protein PAXRUDRAFT_467997 [Paxillus rubicundulus Ve08.2h10]
MFSPVNSRGKGTRTRQRKTTVEQAAAVLLVAVQQGHIELTVNNDDPDTIETIIILPEAKKILATFLPKLRGYGNIPHDQQYRGAVALAKRHFFPVGRVPTKKELMSLLLQCQQEKKKLTSGRPLTRMLSVQTSLETIPSTSGAGQADNKTKKSFAVQTASFASLGWVTGAPVSKSNAEAHSINMDVDAEPDQATSDASFNDDSGEIIPELRMEPVPVVPRTPNCDATRAPHLYMTPVSNPRQTDRAAVVPLLFDSSPTLVTNTSANQPFGSSCSLREDASWISQEKNKLQNVLTSVFAQFASVCQRANNLEVQNVEMQTELDRTRARSTN